MYTFTKNTISSLIHPHNTQKEWDRRCFIRQPSWKEADSAPSLVSGKASPSDGPPVSPAPGHSLWAETSIEKLTISNTLFTVDYLKHPVLHFAAYIICQKEWKRGPSYKPPLVCRATIPKGLLASHLWCGVNCWRLLIGPLRLLVLFRFSSLELREIHTTLDQAWQWKLRSQRYYLQRHTEIIPLPRHAFVKKKQLQLASSNNSLLKHSKTKKK